MLTIALNASLRAPTQFLNFEFNSMVKFNGIAIGANGSGLFSLCCGDTDNGTPIDAYFVGKTSDFGMSNNKRFRYLYFGLETYGNLDVYVIVDEQAPVKYKLDTCKTGQQRIRLPINRREHGEYWAFKVANTKGCDFSIDSIKGLPVVRSNGIA